MNDTPVPRIGVSTRLTLMQLMWRIWRASNNASKWQMGFNSAFKGLNWQKKPVSTKKNVDSPTHMMMEQI
jgi:hypothetical protein